MRDTVVGLYEGILSKWGTDSSTLSTYLSQEMADE